MSNLKCEKVFFQKSITSMYGKDAGGNLKCEKNGFLIILLTLYTSLF